MAHAHNNADTTLSLGIKKTITQILMNCENVTFFHSASHQLVRDPGSPERAGGGSRVLWRCPNL